MPPWHISKYNVLIAKIDYCSNQSAVFQSDHSGDHLFCLFFRDISGKSKENEMKHVFIYQ